MFDTEQLYERFHVPKKDEALADRYNVAPGASMPVIAGGEAPNVKLLRWGITPAWSTERGRGIINARVETLSTKPTFKSLFAHGRCLVPARGWFEWQRAGPKKQPHFFRRRDGDFFAFAGLCDEDEYAIITTAAHPALAAVHDRMPLVLRPDTEGEWLNPDVVEPDRLYDILDPADERVFDFYPVRRAVNRPANDSPLLVQRA